MKRILSLATLSMLSLALAAASGCSDDSKATGAEATELKVVPSDEEEEKLIAEAQAEVSESNAEEVAAALEKEIEADLESE